MSAGREEPSGPARRPRLCFRKARQKVAANGASAAASKLVTSWARGSSTVCAGRSDLAQNEHWQGNYADIGMCRAWGDAARP